MFDEWCAGTGGRLIPLIIVQLWDSQLAAAEIRRNAARGCSSVVATLTCFAAESSVRVDAVETGRSPRSTAATSSDAPLLSTLVAR
jgi:hypothetical protein